MAPNEEIASPGSLLGFEEEFEAGEGTYIDGGKIYSSVAGKVSRKDRRISVSGEKALSKIVLGDVLFGRVEMVIEPIALISIVPPVKEGRFYEKSNEYCVMHASSLGMGYVKNIHEFLKIGDLVKAKVIDIKKTEICLGMNGQDLGIVKAFCAQDRSEMDLDAGMLSCPECGAKEKRKISSEYRKVSA